MMYWFLFRWICRLCRVAIISAMEEAATLLARVEGVDVAGNDL